MSNAIFSTILMVLMTVEINPVLTTNVCGYNTSQLLAHAISINTGGADIFMYSDHKDSRVIAGEEITFVCCALVDGSGWSLPRWNIIPDTTIPHDVTLSFGQHVGHNVAVLYSNMTVTASLADNNTEVTCKVQRNRVYSSAPKTLVVMGPPPSPVPLLEITACRSVKVKWDHAFTWPDYPIIRYNMTVTDAGNNVLINIATVLNEVNVVLENFQSPELEELMFTVIAINSIGESNPGNISLRLQDIFLRFNPKLRVSVLYTSAMEPRVRLTLSLPPFGSYHTLSYSIVVDGVFNNTQQVTSISGTVFVIVNESNVIFLDVPSALGFSINENYNVFATLYSESGQNVSTDPYIFDTTVSFNNNESDETRLYVIVVFCAVLSSCLLLILCGFGAYSFKKKCFLRPSRNITSVMVTNPIYDSPIYDIIKDAKRTPIPSASISQPPFNELAESAKLASDSAHPNDSLELDNMLTLEPRYSSLHDNVDCYVKMEGGVTCKVTASDDKV